MEFSLTEIEYPLDFRKEDAYRLGEHLRLRHSVAIVGMKRVGISNFLRFFLYHPHISETYIHKSEKHTLIAVDLNDLVERELYAFWTLVFKRIVDTAEKIELDDSLRLKIEALFLSSIQSHDLFLLIDGVRRSLSYLIEGGYIPTLFFLRFDRIKDVVTPEFFANLEGLKESLHTKLAYVFTSFRGLDELSPKAFSKASFSAFTETMYLLPSGRKDREIIYKTYEKRYELSTTSLVAQEILELAGGYVQYLQIALVLLHEKRSDVLDPEIVRLTLLQDERITLQSEELWESLTNQEKMILLKMFHKEDIDDSEIKQGEYMIKIGLVRKEKGYYVLFSPLFAHFIKKYVIDSEQKKRGVVFSKKESLLFEFLQQHIGEIAEREEIIDAVWPEYVEFGVSDWSIDRLVARVRSKLKDQASPYEIKTVRTRGYVLISKV